MTTGSEQWNATQCLRQLHPGLIDWMQQQRWRELRPLQIRAAQHVLTSSAPLLITASVASGKTEAAMLPILTKVANADQPGFGILYVAPLVALINDQSERLQSMAAAVGLRATPWHGEVAAGIKRAAKREPYGVLLITPESLDSYVTRLPREIERIFAGLRYLVVDELHVFLGSERGQQLRSALARIEQVLGRKLIRIGLSATLGESESAKTWLAEAASSSVVHLPDTTAAAGPQVELLAVLSAVAPRGAKGPRGVPGGKAEVAVFERQIRAGKHLVFANSRVQVEATGDALRQAWDQSAQSGQVHVHHSNISKDGRLEAEESLRAQPHVVAVCTSTLELGLDVPNVVSVTQIGAPYSAAALKQRAGRTGRRGEPGLLRIVVAEHPDVGQLGLLPSLRLELVQAIAMAELVLAGWFESPKDGQLHLSVLTHQVLALLRQTGGLAPTAMWEILCRDGAFAKVDASLFRALLVQLKVQQLIVQDANSPTIRLDTKGDSVANHYTFPVLFDVPTEWDIVTTERTLGSLPCSAPIFKGDHIVFAGRRWEVTGVVDATRRIEVKPSKAGAVPGFEGGSPGFLDGRVRQQMREIYCSARVPEYLNSTARDLLAQARNAYQHKELQHRQVVEEGSDALVLHWQGDRAAATLRLLLMQEGLAVALEGPALRVTSRSANEVQAALRRIAAAETHQPVDIAKSVPNKRAHKYDAYLGEELLSIDYAKRVIDVAGAVGIARHVVLPA